MKVINFLGTIFLILLIPGINFSCGCHNSKIIHLNFCDFLNNVSSEEDRAQSKIALEKSLHFIVDAVDSRCFGKQNLENFIKNDTFIQSEMHKDYYRLTVTFYKMSKLTEALLKSKSSKNLDYCNSDIIVEYQWIEGKLWPYPFYYENGNIKGSEKIQLDSIN